MVNESIKLSIMLNLLFFLLFWDHNSSLSKLQVIFLAFLQFDMILLVMAKDDEKVVFSTRISPILLKQLKHLAVDQNKKIGDLVTASVELLLKKHKRI
jgi:hypothetical protein